jgi:hypothetical protein
MGEYSERQHFEINYLANKPVIESKLTSAHKHHVIQRYWGVGGGEVKVQLHTCVLDGSVC